MENGETLTSLEPQPHLAAVLGSELWLLRYHGSCIVATVSSAPCWLSHLARLCIVTRFTTHKLHL